MVSWHAPGSVSGFSLNGNITNVIDDALPGLTRDVYSLATSGVVDAKGITRLQYDIEGDNYRRTVDAVARLRFSSAEVTAAAGAGTHLGASMFVINDAWLTGDAVGKTPTAAQILGHPDVEVYRGADITILANTNYEFWIAGFDAYRPDASGKWWLVVAPTVYVVGSTPSAANDLLVGGAAYTFCRGISVFSNRRPEAPVITSPPANSVHGAGTTFDLTYVPKDPDAISGSKGKASMDKAGVQVQYAAQPTLLDPDPEWMDLPITTGIAAVEPGTVSSEVPSEGLGWYIDRSFFNQPSDETRNGAMNFWLDQTMKVLCAGQMPIPRAGVLPSGDWQIRVRTFDYGHPYPRWKAPLNATVDGDPDFTVLQPSLYPESNTSPWSEVVNVSIAAEVLAPVAISPVANVAVIEGQPALLKWQYRNTYSPPYAQRRRQVQIREVGAPDWTTLVSGNSAEDFYSVLDPNPNDPTPDPTPPEDYLSDGGFEGGTTDGWLTNGTGVENVNDLFSAHSGTHSLHQELTAALNVATYQVFTLDADHNFITIEGWLKKGGENVTEQTMSVSFIDSSGTQLAFAITGITAGQGYKSLRLLDLVKPPTATTLQIAIFSSSPTLQNEAWFDDFSVLGSPVRLNEYPETTPVLPTIAPVDYPLESGKHYEWRVRVTDRGNLTSDWSDPARFWLIDPADSGSVTVPGSTIDGATLGCGKHRAFIYRRGGKVRVGELTQLSYVDWNRVRDDMSDAKVIVSGWDIDCGNLLSQLEPWAYELVIFRDNGFSTERVWEGPLMAPTYESDKVTLKAYDVIAYIYRRIIKQMMNDTGTSDTAGDSVVSRAARAIQNGLAPDDPNLLRYLTIIASEEDAKQYRNLPPYSRTVYEEVDDMAANAGLDYTAVGRRIMLWGTKHRIGTLPEFRDEYLGSSPIVSIYGMSTSNRHVISDGNGVYGEADRLNDDGQDPVYGLVETLSSSWASEAGDEGGTYTEEGLETVRESFSESAEKTISNRYPPPTVVRIPDNTTLNPNTPISIQQLVPGVVVPLRSTSTLRTVKANQKLDTVRVIENEGSETISITLSPFSREDTAVDEGEV